MASPPRPFPSVLVVGAGELGTVVLEALARHPARNGGSLTVLLRASTLTSSDPAKNAVLAYIRSLGAALEAGDCSSDPVPDLAATFHKYDVVMQCAGYALPPGTQVRVTQAALAAGVRRYFPFQYGLHYDAIGEGRSLGLLDEQVAVRTLLRAQHATVWTILSTGLFASYLFLPGFGVVDVEAGVVRALGSWDNRVTVTTPDGIGRMSAEAVYVPEGTVSRVLYVAGDTVTYTRLADLLDASCGRKFRRELWDMAHLNKLLADNPDDPYARYRIVFAAGVGTAWELEKTLNHERGIKLMDLEIYIRENKYALGLQA